MKKCIICNSEKLIIHYQGDIRNGQFPNIISDEKIYECQSCLTQFLENYNINYTNDDYRKLVNLSESSDTYYKLHDGEQYEKLSFFNFNEIRNKSLLDIGSGAGSFLDLVYGLSKETYAIEPTISFHENLLKNGHVVYSSIEDMLPKYENYFDFIVCFSVIEHVQDPFLFMKNAFKLLKKGGLIIFSTPNSKDILFEMLPDEYPSFFYRTVHKTYFNKSSLEFISKKIKMINPEIIFKHRFGLDNLLNWLNFKKPSIKKKYTFNQQLDSNYKSEIEKLGVSDYIYLKSTK